MPPGEPGARPGSASRRRSSARRGEWLGVDHAAVAHAHDPSAARGDLGVVGDHQDGLAARVEAGGTARAPRGRRRSRARRWARRRAGGSAVHQGPGDGEALALAAGQHRRALVGLVAEAQEVEQVRARRPRPACAARRRSTAGRATFSSTLMPSSRLKNWKTMPMWRRRMRASSFSSLAGERLAGERRSRRRSGVSRPATRFSRVDLPQPGGPMIATNSPSPTVEVGAAKGPYRHTL